MADTVEKLPTDEASSSSVEASITGENTEPTTTTTEKTKWGDVEDDDEEEANAVSELNSLSIKEEEKHESILDEPEDSNIKAVTSGDTPYTSASRFEDLNLSPELMKGLYVEMKFEKPSKIQAISLPMIITPPHKHLIAQAHNGSGKTTCFVLGMLSRVDPSLRQPQALCICPTRELANQNMEVLQKMGKFTGITAEVAVPESNQGATFARRAPVSAQVVIGTPGTLKKWMAFKKLGLNHLKILVFDEADHMLATDGFRDDSLRIMKDIKRVNPNYQVLLFSATFNETVKDFVQRTVESANQLFVKREDLALDSVKQYKVVCPKEQDKIEVIKDQIMELGDIGQTIIFVKTKVSASKVHKALAEMGYDVTSVHGSMSQEERDKIVKEFKDCLTQVLIATDVLARGFDQQRVNLVVNYNMPTKYETGEPDYEVYLHRVGRAGRFGRKGAVFNLLLENGDDKEVMEKIERYFGAQVKEIKSWNSEEEYKSALKEAGLLDE
ncbi:DEAD-box ATP-dependent RNA helicase 38 [Raphanus sativus]|uniref:RNA helicase n=1 Tax=Raphanus sativus TaxID=3726 RepID=A0A9W3DMN3_RAPSA|nr:DEAD-box ATP-dependent RNA helicase 38 [Raphanus sativus]KAJ4904748.1 DEAD-box ATP-dependent RNA helicase 38 [Raphanus sativus]